MRITKVFVMYLVYGFFCVQSVADSVNRNRTVSLVLTVSFGGNEPLHSAGLSTVLNSLRMARDMLKEADSAMGGGSADVRLEQNDLKALLKIIETQGAVLRAITAVEQAQESLHEAYELIRPPQMKFDELEARKIE